MDIFSAQKMSDPPGGGGQKVSKNGVDIRTLILNDPLAGCTDSCEQLCSLDCAQVSLPPPCQKRSAEVTPPRIELGTLRLQVEGDTIAPLPLPFINANLKMHVSI